MATSDLVDLLIIDGEIVLDEHGLPQLIGGRDVVAQDIGHRLADSGLVFLLIGDRNPNSIKSLLLKIRLEVESDSRIIPGTVTTTFDTSDESGVLNITAETDIGDVSIAVPVIPEEYQELIDDDDEEDPLNIVFSLPVDLGNAESLALDVVDLGSAENVVQYVVDLGNAESELSEEGVIVYE
jgi:hypothetical protein